MILHMLSNLGLYPGCFENCVMRLYLIYVLWGMLVFLFQQVIHSAAFRVQILISLLGVVISLSGQLCVNPLQGSLGQCTCVFQRLGWLGGGLSLPSVHIFRVPLGLYPHLCCSGFTFLSSYDPSGPFCFPGSSSRRSALQAHIYTQFWGHSAGGQRWEKAVEVFPTLLEPQLL